MIALTLTCIIIAQLRVTVVLGKRNADSVAQYCILLVSNVLLQKLMPRYRLPVSLKSDHNEVSRMMCAEPQIEQELDCSYLPEVSSIIKQHKDSTESHVAKDCFSITEVA